MNVILLSGFLGSGKTTILLQLARYLISAETTNSSSIPTPVVIIENEIGEIGVDDKLLKSQGFAVRELFAGCACCTSGGNLLSDIRTIRDTLNPVWLIIEATGIAYPRQIKESIEACFDFPLKILCLADASRWNRLRNAMTVLIEAQLESADFIFVNKIDLCDSATLVADDIRSFNSTANIFLTSAVSELDSGIWSSFTALF